MDNRIITGAISAAGLIILLGILFGLAGFSIGILIAISMASVTAILLRLGFEDTFAFAASLPASLILHSSIAYGLGFFVGLRVGIYISVTLPALIAIALYKLPSINIKKKHNTHGP